MLGLSLVGGESIVPPAEATVTYYHHSGTTNTAALQLFGKSGSFSRNNGDIMITVTVTPRAGSHSGCDASYNDNSGTVGTFTWQFPSVYNDSDNLSLKFFSNRGNNRLVLSPSGTSDTCSYDVVFPDYVGPNAQYRKASNANNRNRITPNNPPGGTFNAYNARAHQAYENNPNPISRFDSTLTLQPSDVVPAGTEFEVAIRQAAGSTATHCSEDSELTLTAVDGAAAEQTVRLVHRHPGSSGPCTYEVDWPDDEAGPTSSFVQTSECDATVSDGSRASACQYSVPKFDGSIVVNTTENVTAATSFIVDVDPPSSPANCSAAQDITVTVAANTSSATAQVPGLVRLPAGASNPCVYTVGWRDHEDGGMEWIEDEAFRATRDTQLSEASSTATNRYAPRPMETPFTPALALSVPPLDGTTAGENIWAGETFAVTVERASDAHADCRLTSTATVTFAVGNDGTVTEQSSELPATLTGTLADGTTTCDYTVTFPPPPTAGANAALSWEMTAPPAATLNGANTSATGAYTVGEVTFDPDPDITVPPGYATETVTATFTSSQTGCRGTPPLVLTYMLQDDRSVTPDASNDSLVAYPAGATTSASACTYDVALSSTEVGGTALARQTGATTSVTLTQQTIAGEYRVAPFTPSVAMSVPRLDGVTAGENIWKDQTFTATVARAQGADGACDLGTAATVTFAVGADGEATIVDSESDLPSPLTDTLADGTTTCDYTVTFQPPPMVAANAELMWTLTAPQPARLNGDDTSVAGAYTVGAVTFVPDANITVPTGHADKQLAVDFTGSAAGCSGFGGTPARLTYTIGAPNTVEPHATNEPLVVYPAGAADLSSPCTYTVAFAANELNGTTLGLQSGSSTEASHRSQAIAASYAEAPPEPTPETNFDGRVELWATNGVPVGTEFSVTVRAQAGLSGCSDDQTFTLASVAPDAAASRTLSDLVDVPEGGSTPCVYDVAWPTNESSGTMSAFIEDDTYASRGAALSKGDATASNRYTAAPEPSDGNGDPGGSNGDPNTGANDPGTSNPPVNNPPVSPPAVNTPTGGTPRPSGSTGGGRTSGGGGGGGRTAGGGSSGGGSSGSSGSATGPWVVAATSRVPVAVSLEMPAEVTFPVGAAIEVMLNVPGECGDDISAFAGLPAEIGLVYALTAHSGTTAQVLAADALQLAGYAERGDSTRDCAVRITLISAPNGCRIQSAEGNATTDDAGRTYVELAGGDDITSYAATPRLVCP